MQHNLPIYALQPSSMLRSCLRAQYSEGLATSCNTRATLEAKSWITNCIVTSFFCSPYIIYICIGIMHWVTSCIVKSRSIFHVILRVDSANSIYKCNLLAWNVLDFKIIQLYCKLYSYRLDGASSKKVTFHV